MLLIIVSATFFSCSEPDLGLEVKNPGDLINLLICDSFTVRTTLERQDSVKTDELSANLLGAYNDPLLGKMRAGIYAQIVPTLSNLSLGEGFIPDSLVMVIPYYGYYGDITKLNGLQKFRVYRVLENMSQADSYYSNDSLLVSSEPIGETGYIVPKINDSVTVTGLRQAPQLRIPVNIDLAADIAANSSALLSIEAFTEFFKGVYITAETKDETPGQGAMLDLILTGGARLDLFYKNNEADSLRISLAINENSARFTRFNHAYSNLVNETINTPALAAELTFTQTMAGLRTRVDFPDLISWQAGRKILVNSARLTVPVDAEKIGIYSPNPIVDLITKDAEGNLIQTPDLLVDGDYPGGIYDSQNKQYVFNIARYIQGRLNGIIEDRGLFIQANGTAVSAYRAPLNGGQHPDRPVKLELLYQILP
ncbi:MAG: DUF4270 family protein [Bacteroidia bacterium]